MTRTVNPEPAVCPRCKTDFSSSGRCRYQVLKRHLKNVHNVVDVDREIDNARVVNITNNTTNNIFIFNGKFDVESVRKLLTPKVIAKLERILDTNDGCTVVPLFNALHCNLEYPDTHIASIPNVSKDCMLVMVREGEVERMSKVDGARKVIDHVMEKDVPVVKKACDEVDFLSERLAQDAKTRYEFVPDIINHMEDLPRANRSRMSNVLKECE